MWHYLCFQKYPKNTIKMGKQWKQKKLGPVFNTRLGPVFNARNPKSYFCASYQAIFKKLPFSKRGCKTSVFQFLCFELSLWKISFFDFAKTLYKWGVSEHVCVFCCWKKMTKMIWNFWICVFLGPKMAVSWRTIVFSKSCSLEPLFYSVLGGARVLGQVVKRGNFGHPQKRKNWLISEKLFFGYFSVCFFCFFVYFNIFLCFCFYVFLILFLWGGPKGDLTWP